MADLAEELAFAAVIDIDIVMWRITPWAAKGRFDLGGVFAVFYLCERFAMSCEIILQELFIIEHRSFIDDWQWVNSEGGVG